jgi:hypothetical protein
MITIIAWMAFLPALAWNAVFFSIVFKLAIEDDLTFSKENIKDSILSILFLIIPGVYLFGIF